MSCLEAHCICVIAWIVSITFDLDKRIYQRMAGDTIPLMEGICIQDQIIPMPVPSKNWVPN